MSPTPEPPDLPEIDSAPAEAARGKKKLWLIAGGATGGAAVVTALAVAMLFAWWRHEPAAPLEDLGLERVIAGDTTGDATAGGAAGESDPEQLAFLERQRRRAGELEEATGHLTEGLESQDGVTLTDRSLIRSLAGRWRLDLGASQVVAEFAPVVVDRVRRGSLLVELYPVDSRSLPPFYTAFELPEKGTYIAFRAADGSYRLVLEAVSFHGPDLFSFQLGSDGQRRTAYRLKGAVPPALDRPPADVFEPGPSPDGAARDGGRSDPPVRIVVEAPPPVSQLWNEAEKLRDEGRLHSLSRQLQRLLNAYPRHRPARRWSRRIDGWIEEQREDLIDDVHDDLGDLEDAIGDRDLGEIFEAWGDRPDPSTRRFFTELLGRHRHLEARLSLQSLQVEDGTAAFSVNVTLEGWSGRSRDREIIPLRWRGRYRDGRFVTPFG